MNEPHQNIPCLHPLARSLARCRAAAAAAAQPTAFYFFAVAHFAVIAISTRSIIHGSVCASVHVDRFALHKQPSVDPYTRLVKTVRSLIKGGVTRVYALP